MLSPVSLSTLGQLSPADRATQLAALVAQARSANGATSAHLRARIRTFEMRYEMSSEELLVALKNGEQRETADVADWLYLLDTLEAHEGAARHGG